jgi:hypothetical protein
VKYGAKSKIFHQRRTIFKKEMNLELRTIVADPDP